MSNWSKCPICGSYQFDTPSGVTCANGHGGVESEGDTMRICNCENFDQCECGSVLAFDARNPLPDDLAYALNRLSRWCHGVNQKWWHTADGVRLDRNKGELLCLIHSEISEAMEGERKNLNDDHLPHRKMVEVELADALIRIFDYAGAFGYDLGGALKEKLAYNNRRKDHTHEARAAAGGKKW